MSSEGIILSGRSPSNLYQPSCAQRPITKITLFVIALLLAGGAIASHFTGLGTIAVATLGATSGAVFITGFVLSLYASYKEKHDSTHDDGRDDFPDYLSGSAWRDAEELPYSSDEEQVTGMGLDPTGAESDNDEYIE